MASLYISFIFPLGNPDLDNFSLEPGVLFHRWLPDGETDALKLELKKTSFGNVDIKMWFERRGVKKGPFIEYDRSGNEFDSRLMKKQGLLKAGPLLGSLTFCSIEAKYIEALRNPEHNQNYEYYHRLGKYAVDLIHQIMSKFIHIVRTKFGQYWVHGHEKWDSRRMSLNTYCGVHSLKWKVQRREEWHNFQPDPPNTPGPSLTLTLRGIAKYEDYISRDDWKLIQKILSVDFQIDISEKLFGRAKKNLVSNDIRAALIDTVTALELAVDEYIRCRLHPSAETIDAKKRKNHVQSLISLNLPTKALMIASVVQNCPAEQTGRILEGIEIRNKLVHEGEDPPSSTYQCIEVILRFVGTLLPLTCERHPSPRPGNMLYN